MPDTFVKIASVTVGSGGAASIDFTSIPSTYTDLQVLLSSRASNSSTISATIVSFNSSSSSFTVRSLLGSGSSASSGSDTTGTMGLTDAATATASTFGSLSLYVPNYASSNYKSFSSDWVQENNASTAYAGFYAGLWSNTAAINALSISLSSGSFVQYSTAVLYGIKNS